MALDEAPTSGAVTLEVELPSGYMIVQSDANKVLFRKEYNFLSDVLVANEKVVWMFDKVGLCIFENNKSIHFIRIAIIY